MMVEMTTEERPSPLASASTESISVSNTPLLRTKLRIPGTASTLLTRPRLNNLLQLQPNGHLTLVSAPAGFGKTTLVIDWVRQQNNPAAWLTLDEQDNDPILFWRYLIAALQLVDKRIGHRTEAALPLVPRVSLETAVTLLINDIEEYTTTGNPLILILDDYFWIHNAAVHQSLNYLLQHQPPLLHLILITRADPPLSLARLRVEGRLVELRATNLRLTPDEIAEFFTQVMALPVSPESLQLLAVQTEGWAAGLQLAALSIRQRNAADATQFVQTFAQMRQHVFAYLMEEVLNHQTDEARRFLQQTAVLPQFCGSLCTAVTGQANANQLLQQLAANNLFLTPLDDEAEWYRYHPLFAEMLRANLDEINRRDCYRRAAQWYVDQRMFQDAMRSALAAEDYVLLAVLLTQTYKTLLAHGLLVSLQKWLAAVPAAYQSPRLRMASAWCRVYESNELELQEIAALIEEQSPEIDAPFQGEILAVQAIYASLYGDLDNAIEWATQALSLIDTEDYLSLAAAYQALGNAYRNQGELDAALAAYLQARKQFEKMGNVFMGQLPLYRVASIQIMQGRLHQAWQTYESIRQRAQAAGHEPLIMSGEVFGHLSDLYLEWNDLEQAEDYARQEIQLAQSGHMLLGLVDGYLKLAAVAAAQRNLQEAREALMLATETAVRFQSTTVSAEVAMHQARHDLAWGNMTAATVWADEFARLRKTHVCPLPPLLTHTADLLLARIWLAQGQTESALVLLQDAVRELEAIGRLRLVTEANVLLALIWTAQNQPAAAQKALIKALALSKHEGYVRVFIENGPALMPLLAQVQHLFPDYVAQLLNEMPGRALSTALPTLFLDPLTEREQEILSLIARGHSNRQIAETLFISVGTVKGHVNHIFSKLDVQNRTQALLRARENQLLER